MEQIDNTRIPRHVAIIMDGNGRWAAMQGKERSYGHQAGAATVHTIAEAAVRMGIEYLTLYTFSTENWKRPESEVAALMTLLFNQVEETTFMKNNVRLRVIGDISQLPEYVRLHLQECIDHTSVNTGMTMVLALSYSARWELTEAMRKIAEEIKVGKLAPTDICDEVIRQHLSTSFMPDPDLLIRTGGELRLSNFLLWQCAYTELYFCHTFWPEFSEEDFVKAIAEYQNRQRRFGKTGSQVEKI